LQEAARDVERQVRTVKDAFQKEEEFRDDLLDVVGDKDLVVVDFDPAFQALIDVVSFREIEDALEVEGVVDVKVDPEEWIAVVFECFAEKDFVVFVRAVLGVLEPERCGVIDWFSGASSRSSSTRVSSSG